MPNVLIIDDETAILTSLAFALEDEFCVHTAADTATGLEMLAREDIDLVLLDLRIGADNGLDVLKRIRATREQAVVIIITAYGSIGSAVECMQAGAYYYVTKPVDLAQLKLVIAKGLEFASLRGKLAYLDSQLADTYLQRGLVGPSKRMRQVFDLVEKVKDIDSNVLITGESGTGKELVARAVHFGGRRKQGRFEVVDCAAIPATLLESELFGFEQGAFTGAHKARKGRFELAAGGTVFLDEIGDMDLALQAKILRILQSREFTPLGSSGARKADVRVIAATNKDLKAEVARGAFREDLYFRLNVIPIELPALRERREDIPALARHFLRHYAKTLGKPTMELTAEALAALEGYAYPGNVRELENMIERAVALCPDGQLCLRDLPPEVAHGAIPALAAAAAQPLLTVYPGIKLADIERLVILRALSHCRGSRRETARLLGLSERTLRHKLKEYKRRQLEQAERQ